MILRLIARALVCSGVILMINTGYECTSSARPTLSSPTTIPTEIGSAVIITRDAHTGQIVSVIR